MGKTEERVIVKIRGVPQCYYRNFKWQGSSESVFDDPESAFRQEHNFITIRHAAETNPFCAIPVEEKNILRLQFDDATENPNGNLTLFSVGIAYQIKDFIAGVDQGKELFVNCAVGISRSGAVRDVLNEYFNRYLEYNAVDDHCFKQSHCFWYLSGQHHHHR